MNRNVESILLATYPLIIGFSIFWSNSTVQKTLYDRYIIYNEGIIFESDKIGQSSDFYSKVLDFPEPRSDRNHYKSSVSSYRLAEQQQLHLTYKENPEKSPIILIRVRNGFKHLHEEFLKRLGKEPQELDENSALNEIIPGSVSSIYKGKLGEQFVTRDPSGNRILFYQKRLRLF